MIERLSNDFTLAEFCKSDAAERLGLDNTPSTNVIANAIALAANVLQPIRDRHGTIHVRSGYRSPAVNKAIGGATTSQHILGQAADIEAAHVSNKALAAWIYDNLEYDQLILEYVDDARPGSGWVHVSYRVDGKNRKQALQINNNGAKPWQSKK